MPIYTDGPGGDINSADDTTFRSAWATFNGGGHGSFSPRGGVAPREHCLLRFNLSAIPVGSTCNSAILYLYHNKAPEGAPNPCTASLHRVSDANSDWVAGTKNVALAGAGECCWNAKAADGAGGVTSAWAGSVGCGTSGTDFEVASIGSYSVDPGDALGTEYQISLDTTEVESWFGVINNGIIIYPTNNSEIHFGQSSDINYEPKLVVDYSNAPVGGGNHIKVLENELIL